MKVNRSALLLGATAAAVGIATVATLPHSTPSVAVETAEKGGIERWSVKTGTDPGAAKVNVLDTSQTTVETLCALPRPAGLPTRPHGDDPTRYPPVETTLYTVHATLTGYKHEADGDYHLVLTGETGATMIAEIPDLPAIHGNSPWAIEIAQARRSFDAIHSNASASLKRTNDAVVVTGVGFFDFIHGQDGVAPNGIELHPVLNIALQ